MSRYQPSITRKITLGYYAIGTIVISLIIFIFMDLRYVEKKIMLGEAISEFFNTILEIRRFEKNYFLYEQESDYQENINYINRAQELLKSNIKEFTALAQPKQVRLLDDCIKHYRELIGQYAELNGQYSTHKGVYDSAAKMALEKEIRKTGKKLVTIAEDISKTERKDLQIMLSKSQHVLMFSVIAFSFLGIVVCQVLARRVVRPLKLLEDSMKIIGDGMPEKIHIDSRDKEIVSLTNVFNKMLNELELRQRHLIQSEKLASLGTLLSGVAHELNNPLSNISSSSQILMEEIGESDIDYKKELLAEIEEQTDRAKNIVRSLLEFSREKAFKKETLPLKKLFEDTIQFVKGDVPTKVDIVMDIPEDIEIFADKQRMQQTFLNLIKNAIEAILEEGRVSITARKVIHKETMEIEELFSSFECQAFLPASNKDNVVYIKICDTGKGMEPEILLKIFDPFFTTKDVGKGSGLGLFIIHEIIKDHDGCIGADSLPGKGTTFLIRLPMPKATKAPE